jgi:hypothetical protein
MPDALDLRGPATHECVCGSNIWQLFVTFADDAIAMYDLNMTCAECGSLATAPYPEWRKDWENEQGYAYPLDRDLRVDSDGNIDDRSDC